MREPGQLLFETSRPDREFFNWDLLNPEVKVMWAGIEAAVRADERERCAKVADEQAELFKGDFGGVWTNAAQSIAAAIRKLGEGP